MADRGSLGDLRVEGVAPTRFGEVNKLLPVSFVLITLLVLYTEYTFLHCLRLLQVDLPSQYRKQEDVVRGYIQMSVFHVITGMLLYCLTKCILTDPGTIPDAKGWELRTEGEDSQADDEKKGGAMVELLEKKHTGERRHCKWCLKYKPDRCHHCRICNICILRMDHHCPWVYNCIGFRNHKYFFLLLVYASIDTILVNITMFESVWWSTRVDVSLITMLALTFGEVLATFLFVLITSFLSFHIWLMMMAMTTVEFCEKSLKKTSYNSSVYSIGAYRNICAVLGDQPLFWLLPLSLPSGDGLSFQSLNAPDASAASSGNEKSEMPASSSPPESGSGEERRRSSASRGSGVAT